MSHIFKRIAIASDHGGYDLKSRIIEYFRNKIEIIDFGTKNSMESVDYPDFAQCVSRYVIENSPDSCGILICKTGIGMSISSNRFKNIRAALCYNKDVSILSRQHNNANIICFGASFIDSDIAIKCVEYFIGTEFQGGRHHNRINKIEDF